MANEQKTYELSVEPREPQGKGSRKIRREALVPGVVYGHRVESQSVQVGARELERVYLRAGSTTLIDLKVGDGTARKVFIHDVQRDPVSHSLQHVDFIAVNLREEMTAGVAIVLTGEPEPVARGEGILLHQLDHLQVRALPMDLPHLFEVDVSGLSEIGDAIHVSDLEIPENVTLLASPDDVIAKVVELRVAPEEEEEAAEAEEAEEAAEGEGAVSETEEASDTEEQES